MAGISSLVGFRVVFPLMHYKARNFWLPQTEKITTLKIRSRTFVDPLSDYYFLGFDKLGRNI